LARGKKTGGRDIVQGQVLNPHGRPKESPEVKAIKIQSKEEVANLYWRVLNTPYQHLLFELADPSKSLFEHNILRAIEEDIKRGSIYTIEKLTERTLGKPKEFIDLSALVASDKAIDLSKLSTEEIKVFYQLYNRARLSDANGTGT
jgi:hypothetical protein